MGFFSTFNKWWIKLSLVFALFARFAGAQTIPVSIEEVVNAASFAQGPIAPGTIISVFGSGMARSTTVASSLPLSMQLDGSSVPLNGQSLPLFFVSPGQINAQLPFEVQNGPAQLTVTNATGLRASIGINIAAASPGIFTLTSD